MEVLLALVTFSSGPGVLCVSVSLFDRAVASDTNGLNGRDLIADRVMVRHSNLADCQFVAYLDIDQACGTRVLLDREIASGRSYLNGRDWTSDRAVVRHSNLADCQFVIPLDRLEMDQACHTLVLLARNVASGRSNLKNLRLKSHSNLTHTNL